MKIPPLKISHNNCISHKGHLDPRLDGGLIPRKTICGGRDGLDTDAGMAPKMGMSSDLAEKITFRVMAMAPVKQ